MQKTNINLRKKWADRRDGVSGRFKPLSPAKQIKIAELLLSNPEVSYHKISKAGKVSYSPVWNTAREYGLRETKQVALANKEKAYYKGLMAAIRKNPKKVYSVSLVAKSANVDGAKAREILNNIIKILKKEGITVKRRLLTEEHRLRSGARVALVANALKKNPSTPLRNISENFAIPESTLRKMSPKIRRRFGLPDGRATAK